jgi:catechol 2,3-dioxygenase-like lactoylglutathione lyase family enzyme
MPSFAGVHHVDLVVSSIERSLPFYRDLLAPLGYHRITEVEGERGETIWYLGGPEVALGLREAQTDGAIASESTTSPSRRGRAGSSTSARPGSPSAEPRSRAIRRNTGTARGTTQCSSTTLTASSSKSSTCQAWLPERRVPR